MIFCSAFHLSGLPIRLCFSTFSMNSPDGSACRLAQWSAMPLRGRTPAGQWPVVLGAGGALSVTNFDFDANSAS